MKPKKQKKTTLISVIADESFNDITKMSFMLNKVIKANSTKYDYGHASSKRDYFKLNNLRSSITVQYMANQKNMVTMMDKYREDPVNQILSRLNYEVIEDDMREVFINNASDEKFNKYIYIVFTNFSTADKIELVKFISTLHTGHVYLVQYEYSVPDKDFKGAMVSAPEYVYLNNTEHELSRYLQTSTDVDTALYNTVYNK